MEFIYDRTQADVDRVKELTQKYIDGTITGPERQEWLEDSKGALNLSDLNRIEGNMQELAGLLGVIVSTRQWDRGDEPSVSEDRRILGNLKVLRDAWYVMAITPENPAQPLNEFKKWNDIERILSDLYHSYTQYIENLYYCGTELYAGEGIGDL